MGMIKERLCQWQDGTWLDYWENKVEQISLTKKIRDLLEVLDSLVRHSEKFIIKE